MSDFCRLSPQNSRRRPVKGVLHISGDGLRVVEEETKVKVALLAHVHLLMGLIDGVIIGRAYLVEGVNEGRCLRPLVAVIASAARTRPEGGSGWITDGKCTRPDRARP